MDALKTMWRILISLPVAVTWMVMALLLYLGWGLPQVDKFIRAWNASMEEEDGPITGGPLPPDPLFDSEVGKLNGPLIYKDETERKKGEGIG